MRTFSYSADYDEVNTAKTMLRSKIGRPVWLRGVGIGCDKSGFFIRVNVDEITNDVNVPREINGVRVLVEAVGNIGNISSR